MSTSDTIAEASKAAAHAIEDVKSDARTKMFQARERAYRLRDETQLQAHLMNRDMKDKLAQLQERYSKIEARANQWQALQRDKLEEAKDHTADELEATFKEIGDGFKRMIDAAKS